MQLQGFLWNEAPDWLRVLVLRELPYTDADTDKNYES